MINLRIGSRGSKLALIQANMLKDHLASFGINCTIVTIETAGDIDRTTPISRMKSVGVFVSELNDRILSGEIDAAVHSAKDIPTFLPESIEISSVLKRWDASDVLVSEHPLSEIEPGQVIGTSSVRREYELKNIRTDLKVSSIRGNIDTRISRVLKGDYAGVIVAKAAIERMQYKGKYFDLDLSAFPPAANQGIIATTAKKNSETAKILKKTTDINTHTIMSMERMVLEKMHLSCNDPVSVYISGDKEKNAFIRVYSLNGHEYIERSTVVKDLKDLERFIDDIRKSIPESYGYKWR